MSNNKFLGDVRILEIKRAAWLDFKPVGCLTGNPFIEDVEMLPTTTRANNGWRTSEPTTQGYSVSFTGFQLITESGPDTDKASYDEIKVIKRAREKIEWRILGPDGTKQDDGEGHFNQLSEENEVGAYLTFSGSIEGYGEPNFVAAVLVNGLIFSNSQQIQFSNGENMVFK